MNTNACKPPLDRSIAFVLLAAGEGERFGGGKLQAALGGRPLWRWAAAHAEEAGFATRHVVSNDAGIARDAAASGWIVHANALAAEGIASSIRIAVSAAAASERLVLALADMPFVEPGLLRVLALAEGVTFTRHADGRDGVPAAFPQSAFAELATLTGNRGAGGLNWQRRSVVIPNAFDSLLDVDTPEDLTRAEAHAVKSAPAIRR